MGIMDWFKSSGTKDERQVERYVKKLTNKYVQTIERKRMIDRVMLGVRQPVIRTVDRAR